MAEFPRPPGSDLTWIFLAAVAGVTLLMCLKAYWSHRAGTGYTTQLDRYEEQQRKVEEQQLIADDQQRRSEEQMRRAERLMDREEACLDRIEAIIKRFEDRITAK